MRRDEMWARMKEPGGAWHASEHEEGVGKTALTYSGRAESASDWRLLREGDTAQ